MSSHAPGKRDHHAQTPDVIHERLNAVSELHASGGRAPSRSGQMTPSTPAQTPANRQPNSSRTRQLSSRQRKQPRHYSPSPQAPSTGQREQRRTSQSSTKKRRCGNLETSHMPLHVLLQSSGYRNLLAYWV
ncbi:hypothetical protein GN244_ATG03037 [Phytophthora infestans]|uniref:Uncharacterized protein n=1 Tax=Phytophthora infestans TaxID=4787 RepID=A0A833X0M3_PHYIN|nr:hypothetical protein GN244_ATG03037 [Phytophthora infestans]KAF4132693.1 hypothetical protein GN958_ATG18105 [Phytophthora infestans]